MCVYMFVAVELSMSGFERVVRKAPDFVERVAQAVVVSYPDDGSIIVLDFLKPSLDIVVDESGRITSVKGELELSVRVFLPPVVAKRLLRVLENVIRGYEEKFGEIKDVRSAGSEGGNGEG